MRRIPSENQFIRRTTSLRRIASDFFFGLFWAFFCIFGRFVSIMFVFFVFGCSFKCFVFCVRVLANLCFFLPSLWFWFPVFGFDHVSGFVSGQAAPQSTLCVLNRCCQLNFIYLVICCQHHDLGRDSRDALRSFIADPHHEIGPSSHVTNPCKFFSEWCECLAEYQRLQIFIYVAMNINKTYFVLNNLESKTCLPGQISIPDPKEFFPITWKSVFRSILD